MNKIALFITAAAALFATSVAAQEGIGKNAKVTLVFDHARRACWRERPADPSPAGFLRAHRWMPTKDADGRASRRAGTGFSAELSLSGLKRTRCAQAEFFQFDPICDIGRAHWL